MAKFIALVTVEVCYWRLNHSNYRWVHLIIWMRVECCKLTKCRLALKYSGVPGIWGGGDSEKNIYVYSGTNVGW
jgi:hypothetical protein